MKISIFRELIHTCYITSDKYNSFIVSLILSVSKGSLKLCDFKKSGFDLPLHELGPVVQ